MMELDHLAITCADLDKGADWLSDQLGLPLLAGGKHAAFGTHNKLLGLADGLYLEVIAPDPDVQMTTPRWFNLDHAPVLPRWGNWICRTADFDTHAAITGPAIAMSRGDLRWQITVPHDGSLPLQGAFPTLIQWDSATDHPATLLPASGVRLIRWEVHHPDAKTLRALCQFDDPRIAFVPDETLRFVAHFDAPAGRIIL
ncbi:MAG: VOC family protein [Yoonia sp.]|nr:VOC family protein [Yoonia sp.]